MSSSSTVSTLITRSSPSESGFTSMLWCITEKPIVGIISPIQPVHSTSVLNGSTYSAHWSGFSSSSPEYRTKTDSSPLAFTTLSSGRRSIPRTSMVYHKSCSMFGLLDTKVTSSLIRIVSFLCTIRLIKRTFFLFTEIPSSLISTGSWIPAISSTTA